MADLSEREKLADALGKIVAHCHYGTTDQKIKAIREAAAYLRSEPERNEAIEECAQWIENYPSPLNDLPMALAMRDLATGLRNLKESQ